MAKATHCEDIEITALKRCATLRQSALSRRLAALASPILSRLEPHTLPKFCGVEHGSIRDHVLDVANLVNIFQRIAVD